MSAVRALRDDRPAGNALQRLYRGQTNFDFINRWKIWFAASGLVIVIGLGALAIGGLNFSIDFRGGSLWQVPTKASVASVRADMNKISPVLGQADILQLTNPQTGAKSIQVEASASLTGDTQLVEKVTQELANVGRVAPDQVTAELIGPSWGSSISKKAIEAVVVFLVLIAIAISLYFEAKMAVGALVALVHDILITVGIYALSGFQVSPDTVIAFLTVMGYSLYDTIVVFDKVKENTKGLASTNKYTYTDVVNLSMNQVMARSVNTSFVAIMPVFCILVIGSWILGASALNDFGLALFIGLMSGAYSSIFIASPILALLKEREPRYVEIRRRLAAYPQSRQVLTANMVADGAVVSRAPAALAPGRVGATIGRPSALTSEQGSQEGAGRPALGGANGGSPPGAPTADAEVLAGGATAAPGSEFESYAGPVRPRGTSAGRSAAAGNGRPSDAGTRNGTGGTMARGKGAAAGTPAAGTPAAGTPAAGTPAAGTPAAGTPAAGTPAAGKPAGGRSVPPRPRKKAPRKR